MNNYVKLISNLEELFLKNIKMNLDKYIEMINSQDKWFFPELVDMT